MDSMAGMFTEASVRVYAKVREYSTKPVRFAHRESPHTPKKH
jgi:hypothetical protein